MSSASIKKIIPCKKDQLIKMVLDIEKYPEFVPWCIDGKIINIKSLPDDSTSLLKLFIISAERAIVICYK